MTFVRIGDVMAIPIAWLALVFLLIFIAALGLIVVMAIVPVFRGGRTAERPRDRRWQLPSAGTARDELWFALKVLGGFGTVVALLAYANYCIWTDIYGITISPAGDWQFENPFGATIGSVSAGELRTVGVGSHTTTYYRANQSNSTTAFTDFYVCTASGAVWELSTNDGEQVRAALGYGNLAVVPLEIGADGGYRIGAHTYGPQGPVFAAGAQASAAFSPDR
ncbi:MAG TPA: hypothetical protein PKM88_06170 [bacterium]|nr:hypothetical protein [bacterium]